MRAIIPPVPRVGLDDENDGGPTTETSPATSICYQSTTTTATIITLTTDTFPTTVSDVTPTHCFLGPRITSSLFRPILKIPSNHCPHFHLLGQVLTLF